MKKKNILELTRCTVEEYTVKPKLPLRVLADNVRSMHNVGSLLRTSDAFMVEELLLAGITGCPPHPEITKSALGAEESVAWRYVEDAVDEVSKLHDNGWKVCVLEQVHGSIPLQDFRAEDGSHYLLVVGNEVSGVNQEIVDMADIVLEIPQWGTKHSLNVSVSGGIAIYTLAMSIMNLCPVQGLIR